MAAGELSAPKPGAPPSPPSALNLLSAELFLSVSCFPTPEVYTTAMSAGFKLQS